MSDPIVTLDLEDRDDEAELVEELEEIGDTIGVEQTDEHEYELRWTND
jgi:hypothetical protein